MEDHLEAERGTVRMRDVGRTLKNIAAQAEVVGMSFAEHMPWDALCLKDMLSDLPFMK